jgi:hypothetical protein
MAALCVLTAWIAASKFIAGAICALPLLMIPYRRLPRAMVLGAVAAVLAVPVAYVLFRVVLGAIVDLGVTLHRTSEVDQQLALLRTAHGWQAFFHAADRFAAAALSIKAWAGPLGWSDMPLAREHLTLITASAWLALVCDVWYYGPQIVKLIRTRAPETALLAAIGVGGLAFAMFSDAAIYYIVTTPPGDQDIAGMVIRHLFAAAILALLLPTALLAPREDGHRSRSVMIVNTAALVLLPLLFAARNVELAIDLLRRYWG